MEVKIIEAKKKDIPAILDLYAVEDIDNGNVLPVGEAEKIFSKIQTYPNYKVYIALADGKIAGTFALAIMDNLAHLGKSSGLVEDVVVAKEMRSQGIGKKMMEHALKICKENNCYKMCLSSNIIRKRAHSFYERLGFEKHGYSFMIKINT